MSSPDPDVIAAPPTRRTRIAPRGAAPVLAEHQVLALEAFADTVVPGCKRSDDDPAIAGVSETPGAVECGALAVLTDPATGIEDGIGEMAELLDGLAAAWSDDLPEGPVERFADLSYVRRRALVAELTGPDEPAKDLWFLVSLFSTMAYDSAPHLETEVALDPSRTPASGLRHMGFRGPVSGRWSFPVSSYRRPLARLREGTDQKGDPR